MRSVCLAAVITALCLMGGCAMLTAEQQQDYDRLLQERSVLEQKKSALYPKAERAYKNGRKYSVNSSYPTACGRAVDGQRFGPLPFVKKRGVRVALVPSGAVTNYRNGKCNTYRLEVRR